MRIMHFFDVEVFLHNWLVVFKNSDTAEYTVIHDDFEGVKLYVKQNKVLVGFNNIFLIVEG